VTIWCDRCQVYGHGEKWHVFSYRRWWLLYLWAMGTRKKKGTA
jgi:hypothetical protein